MLLMKSDEKIEAGGPPTGEEVARMKRFAEEMRAARVLLGGEGLRPSSRGARVRLTPRGFEVIDGPFAEAKELIGGYCLLRTDSREQALDWLRRVPLATAAWSSGRSTTRRISQSTPPNRRVAGASRSLLRAKRRRSQRLRASRERRASF